MRKAYSSPSFSNLGNLVARTGKAGGAYTGDTFYYVEDGEPMEAHHSNSIDTCEQLPDGSYTNPSCPFG